MELGEPQAGPGAPSPGAGAEVQLPEKPTLDDYLRYALERSERVRAAYYRWRSAKERIPQARSLEDPMVGAEFGVEQGGRSYHVDQTFPWFGKLELRGEMASEEAEVMRVHYEEEKLDLLEGVRETYYELAYLTQAIAIADANLQLLQHWEEVARRRFEAGETTSSDLLKAQVELGKLTNDLISLKQTRPTVVARLNALLSRPAEAPLPDPPTVTPEELAVAEEELWQQARTKNLGLQAMDHEIGRGTQGVALAKTDALPNFTLGVMFMDMDGGMTSMTSMPGESLVLSLAVNVPLWLAKVQGRVAEARSDLFASEHDRRQAEFDLANDFKFTLFQLQDAGRKLSLYRDALIPKAEESLRSAEANYIGGRGDFLTLLDSQRMLLMFQLEYQRAIADHQIQLAKLQVLLGGDPQGLLPGDRGSEPPGGPPPGHGAPAGQGTLGVPGGKTPSPAGEAPAQESKP